MDLRLVRIAAVVALFGALALAGCGRKAGLDPPPASAVSDPTTIGTEPDAPPAIGPDGKPIAPPSGKKRWLPIDVLLD